MNTIKLISASGAIFMTATMMTGVANLADGHLAPMSANVATATVLNAPLVTKPTAKPTIIIVATNAKTMVASVGILNNATVAKWERLTVSGDARTMAA